MIKSKVLKIVLFSAILLTTVFFIVFFYLKYKENIFSYFGIETKQTKDSKSAFGTMVGGTTALPDKLNEGVRYINDLRENVGKNVVSTQPGSQVTPYVWNYKTSFMRAFIIGKDLTKGTLTLRITVPNDKPFSNINKEIKVNCTTGVSTLISPMDLEIVETNVNILEKARPGVDGITAFCLDENCDLIGKSCAIILDLYGFLRSNQ